MHWNFGLTPKWSVCAINSRPSANTTPYSHCIMCFSSLTVENNQLWVKSLTIVTTHPSLTADRNIFQCSSILAKRKSTENQAISVLCGVLPFLIVTPERLELSTQWLRVICSTNWATESFCESCTLNVVMICAIWEALESLFLRGLPHWLVRCFPQLRCKVKELFCIVQIFLKIFWKYFLYHWILHWILVCCVMPDYWPAGTDVAESSMSLKYFRACFQLT